MAESHYCWRCKKVVPFLNEDEWAQVEPLIRKSVEDVQRYREETGAPVSEALGKRRATASLAKFAQLTGYFETDANAIWHHRRSNYGSTCASCGELLRTTRARRCAGCGRAAA
jgi:hypothetical protein